MEKESVFESYRVRMDGIVPHRRRSHDDSYYNVILGEDQ